MSSAVGRGPTPGGATLGTGGACLAMAEEVWKRLGRVEIVIGIFPGFLGGGLGCVGTEGTGLVVLAAGGGVLPEAMLEAALAEGDWAS